MEKKIYEKKSEKVIDFLIGFLAIPWGPGLLLSLAGYLTSSLFRSNYIYSPIGSILYVVLLVSYLIFAIYLGRKRKYIGIGLLYALVVIPLVLLGTCLLAWGGTSIFGLFFRR